MLDVSPIECQVIYKKYRVSTIYENLKCDFHNCFLRSTGVILSPVLCETLQERSFLLVLDARSFTEIARAYIPQNVQMSMTFHGTYTKQTHVNGDSTAVSVHL